MMQKELCETIHILIDYCKKFSKSKQKYTNRKTYLLHVKSYN